MEDTLQFKISSALKDLVGKDLITSDNVAIFELVKNSYDAYANHVIITFSEDKITIADNGKGMSYSDLINKWLFLGFSAKKDGSEDLVDEKQKSYRDKIKRYYYKPQNKMFHFCKTFCSKITLVNTIQNVI